MKTKLSEFKKINEDVTPKEYINEDKLIEAAKAIKFLCDGEYGWTYWNKANNHVLICLGDSNPFDSEGLDQYLRQIICRGRDYKIQELIKIEIADEYMPNAQEEGWFAFKNDKFIEYKR